MLGIILFVVLLLALWVGIVFLFSLPDSRHQREQAESRRNECLLDEQVIYECGNSTAVRVHDYIATLDRETQ